MDLNQHIKSAEEIQATRKFQAIEQANQKKLSKEESLELFIDADLGSIQVYAIVFSLSFLEAIDLYLKTAAGANFSKDYLVDLFKEEIKLDRGPWWKRFFNK
ncbi:MAG: hypothetical protein KKF78_08640 [Candidatus Omnitrophica bacterium]|nr:hypothetical protein [Candidatus Omnitrophota bacterium]MBU1997207.1 hypothetical protein [Candidatus Omnitrophota bacterium]